MQFWEKVMKDLEVGASTISEKASEWFKVGAEKVKEGAGFVSEKAKEVSRFTQLKWSQHSLNQQIETVFIDIGEIVFDEWAVNKKMPALDKLAEKIEQAKKFEAERKKIDDEIAELSISLSRGDFKELEKDLEQGGGTIKQIEMKEKSPLCGKKLKELTLPSEVLIGTIVRGEEVIIPDGNTELLPNDKITIMGKKEEVLETVALFTEK